MSGAAASVGAACVALAAAAARLGRTAVSSKRRSRAVVLQATFDASETAPTDIPRAQFSFAGVSAPAPISPAARQSTVAMHLLMPKNIRWRKPHKPSMKPFHHSTRWKFRGWATTGIKPHFGKYALQILEEKWISARSIEEHRRRMTRVMERKGKVFLRVFPHNAITQRVAESRMGAGKGSIKYWCAAVRPYFILYEIDGVSEEVATEAFRKVSYLLGCRSRMLKKEDGPSMYELGLSGKPKKRRDPRDFGQKKE